VTALAPRVLSAAWPFAFAAFAAFALALTGTLAACHDSAPGDPSQAGQDVDLPGVDTHEFTPREKHEFSAYVTQFPSPCSTVAVPIAECVTGKRPCGTCLPAAQVIAKAVREGMARDQVEHLYKERFDSTTAVAIPADGSPARGPDDAPVTIVEFADFECPFCQRIAPELDALWEKRKTTVRFVYKFMPLSMHPHGEIAARAAIAAQAQGKFWEMHHLLFANGEHLDDAALQGYAASIGLDVDRFRADLQSDATKARLDADRKLGDKLQVKGTPTIFINGREYDAKIDIDEWVDGEIAGASSAH
jgi:protein-disulfide isomerase